jgi:hypothetical protein
MVDAGGHTLVGDYIDELSYRQALRDGLRSGRAMVTAFVTQAAFIQSLQERGRMLFPPGVAMHLLLRQILAGWDAKTAGKVLLEALGDDAPAEVLASFWVWRARESGVIPADGERLGDIIDKASLKELGRRTLAAILAERGGGLKTASYYWDIMHTWSHLGVAAEAKAWLSATVKADAHALAKVARGILARSMDGGQNQWFFRGLGDAVFYDPLALLAASETWADAPGLDADETAQIIALRDGLRAAHRNETAQAKARAKAKAAARRKSSSKPRKTGASKAE